MMNAVMVLLATLFSIFAIVLNQPLLGVSAWFALLIPIVRLEKELKIIDRAIRRLSDPSRSGGKGKNLVEHDFTLRTHRILDALSGLTARLSALSWESEEDNRANLTYEREVRVDDFSPEELFQDVMRFAEERFRASGGAIVFRRNQEAEWEFVHFGSTGQRLQARLSHLANMVSGPKGNDFIGLRDGFEEQSIFSDFGPFGLRYSIVSQFKSQGDISSEGILWLGYTEDRVPTKTELSWADALCRFINLQFNTKTKIKDLHGELRRVQSDTKAQTRFFADLSHDVRTPLNNLKNILALAKFEETSTETRSMLEAALDSCDHVADMMEDILIYSQSQAGAIHASPRAISLQELLSKLVSTFRGSAEIKKLELSLGKIEEGAVVTVDLKHLRRILSNLISNSIKYTKKGRVSIHVESRSSDTWSVIIKDTGIGMSNDEVHKLFTPFQRFERGSEVEGVGLGLALSKILADANGALLIPSSRLGFGSEFELRLPRAGVIYKNSEASEQRVDIRISVLLVDDDLDYLSSTAQLLERFGYEVMTSASANEAVGIMKMANPSLVVTDGTMLQGSGEDVCRAAQSLRIPAIVVSGKSDELFMARMDKAGAKAILQKPVDINDLVQAIKSSQASYKAA